MPMRTNAKLVEFKTIRGEPYVSSKRTGGHFMRFLSLCKEHYFCLSQVAQALGVSTTTMRKSFTAYAGISPKVWITQQRVILSMRLIREGNSLSEVAEKMVYSDYQHMAKEFRSVVEYTPKSMLKILKGLQEA